MINDTQIPKTDPSFIRPYTQHGMSSMSQNPIYFEIDGVQCVNSTANNFSCVSPEDMDQILAIASYTILFADNFFDPSNYHQPVSRYQHLVAGAASPVNLANNYMNINNVEFTTNDGLIFDNSNTISSYIFSDRVEEVEPLTPGDYENTIFYFRMESQNTPIYYDRTYTTLQEQLANIGGMIKVLFLLAKILNDIYAYFSTKPFYLKKVFEAFISSESYSRFKSMMRGENKKEAMETSTNLNESQFDKLFIKPSYDDQPISTEKPLVKFKQQKNLKSKMLHLSVYQSSVKIKNKIFNEFTIYKLFFEVEKLKRLLFDKDQYEAFDLVKLDINSLFSSNKSGAKKTHLIEKLSQKETDKKINNSLLKLLKNS